MLGGAPRSSPARLSSCTGGPAARRAPSTKEIGYGTRAIYTILDHRTGMYTMYDSDHYDNVYDI